jgi:hypothetical protein
MTNRYLSGLAFCALLLAAASAMAQQPITYQGQLKQSGTPFTGTPDLEFRLYDSLVGGTQIGPALMRPAWPVQDGLFQVELDFGAGAFGADPRWLEIVVDGTALSPRQAINPAPVALYSLDSDGGASPAVWSVNGTATYYDTGNVGIGTASPQADLEIQGASAFPGSSGQLRVTATSGAISAIDLANAALPDRAWSLYAVMPSTDPTNDEFGIFNSGSKASLLLTGDDRLAVGNVVPLAPMSLASQGRFSPGIANGYGDFYIGDGDIGFSIGVATAGGGRGVTRLWTNGGENRIKLGSAAFGDVLTVVGDRVGIGTGNAVPGNDLDINGSVRVRGLAHGDSTTRQVRVDSDGDLVAATSTREIMIPPAQFLPSDHNVDFQRGDLFRITDGDDIAWAGVQLPDGARVVEMRAWVQDFNSGRDIVLQLKRCLPASVPLDCDTLGDVRSRSSAVNRIRAFNDSSIDVPVIDNFRYYYRIEANPEGSDWNGFAVHGVRIRVVGP